MSIYKDNIGQTISITTNAHGGTVTSKVLNVLKPDLTEDTWTLSGSNPYTYVLQSTDVDQAGTYKCQIAFEFAGGIELLSNTFQFEVKELWT